jgi:predicted GNAT family acetyltransferase
MAAAQAAEIRVTVTILQNDQPGQGMTVEHDEQGHRFYIRLPDGEAELVYAEFGEGILDLQHTEVPPSARGSGAGDALVRAALAHARAQGQKVVATCPYVQHWLKAHPGERP